MAYNHAKIIDNHLLIGRYEWCCLPQLALPVIKAKVDTGAKTSAIHAFNIQTTWEQGAKQVLFEVLPLQGNEKIRIACSALVIDERHVMSSNGHKEHRYVITTQLGLGERQWPIELTLSNRDPLRFRMLLGRQALNKQVLVDPSLTCHQRKLKNGEIRSFYRSNEKN